MSIMSRERTMSVLLVALTLLSLVLSACGGGAAAEATTVSMPGHNHPMAPLTDMPLQVRVGEPRMQEAYQFSVANREISEQMPCYCGCVGIGHETLYDCYVSSEPGESLEFDPHAQGCAICVDITHDTMRLMDEGRSPADIRAYIDETYAEYGPPTVQQETMDHSQSQN
jgi:hypothetical protein